MRTIKKTVALAQRYFGTPLKALTAAQENQTTSPSNNKHLNDPSKLANEFNRQFTPSSNNMPTKTYHSHYVSSPWTKGHHLPYPPFQHLSDSMCSLSPWLTTCIISLLKPNKHWTKVPVSYQSACSLPLQRPSGLWSRRRCRNHCLWPTINTFSGREDPQQQLSTIVLDTSSTTSTKRSPFHRIVIVALKHCQSWDANRGHLSPHHKWQNQAAYLCGRFTYVAFICRHPLTTSFQPLHGPDAYSKWQQQTCHISWWRLSTWFWP